MSSLKYQKSSAGINCWTGIDRLSNLPDLVLEKIISFLPTKYAVGTSVLSSRWRYLFTSLTNIDLDDSLTFSRGKGVDNQSLQFFDTITSYCSSYDKLESLNLSPSFKNFVDRVMMLCTFSRLHRFRLKCGWGFDYSNVCRWISVAVLHGVEELNISIRTYQQTVVPCSLFTSGTLVELKLGANFSIKLPQSVYLPSLKILHLNHVNFSLDHFDHVDEFNHPFCRLIAGCPMIEELYVLVSTWDDAEVIKIVAPALKNLILDFCSGLSSQFHRSEVILDAPSLVCFKYVDYLATKYLIRTSATLVDAHIEILLYADCLDAWSSFSSAAVSLIGGLSFAKQVCLSGQCMEALEYDAYKLPVFCNLTCLELGWSKYVSWRYFLPDFLKAFPSLENLVFPEGLLHPRLHDDDEDGEEDYWEKLEEVPPCFESHLKSVKLLGLVGFEEEIGMAKYFLRNAKVLKELIIAWPIKSEAGHQAWKEFFKSPRASNDCLIRLSAHLFNDDILEEEDEDEDEESDDE